MSVKQVLESMDSMEYSEWIAYERAYGPLDATWTEEWAASLHEQMQTLCYMFSQANFTGEKGPSKGPYPTPQQYPRPDEALKLPPRILDEDFEEEWLPPSEDELVAESSSLEDSNVPEVDPI